MKKLAIPLGLLILATSAGTMWADGIGLPVTGILTLPNNPTNYFDSANGAVPAGYGNSNNNGVVTIGSGTEFAATNGLDLFTIDFTGTQVFVTDTCLVVGSCGLQAFTAEFFSPDITGYTVDTFDFPGASVAYNYDPQFGGFAGFLTFAGDKGFDGGTASFDFAANAPVPEPGTLGLLVTGLLGTAGAIRRKLVA